MIDCHAHLAAESFKDDLAETLSRAREVGVETVIAVSEGIDDAMRTIELTAQHDMVRACVGVHPDRATVAESEAVCDLIEQRRAELVGIGEVGLDYWIAKEEEQRSVQRDVLTRFVSLSNELDLPLNVHSRSAGHYTVDLLIAEKARRVLMHAFDGKASHALRGVDAGFFFSIPPSIVRSPQKQKLVRRLPLSALMLETDSPVLGPEKDSRNEPCNALRSAQMIAEIKDCDLGEVLDVTTANARALFGL